MIVLDTQGIVLRAVKYRDKDLILTIFTRKYGKVSAIAKGAQGQKSRFLSASQLFSYNNYNLRKQKDMFTLYQADNMCSSVAEVSAKTQCKITVFNNSSPVLYNFYGRITIFYIVLCT